MFLLGFTAGTMLYFGALAAALLAAAVLEGSIKTWSHRKVVRTSVVALVALAAAVTLMMLTDPTQPDDGTTLGFVLGLFSGFLCVVAYFKLARLLADRSSLNA